MPRRRNPLLGPPVKRVRAVCQRCKIKRLKCADQLPCAHCKQAGCPCVPTAQQQPNPKAFRNSEGLEDDVTEIDFGVAESSINSAIRLTPGSSKLLENEQLRMLWHHYLGTLAILHTPHGNSAVNPIITILGPFAVHSDSLLSVLLAASLENYCALRGQPPQMELLTTLINYAITQVSQELATMRDTQAPSIKTLATVVALCDYEVVARKRASSSSWTVHFDGAKRLVWCMGGPRGEHDSPIFRFLIKWLAYFDISGSLTATRKFQPLASGSYWTDGDAGESFSEYSLDPYMGYILDVVPLSMEIGQLAERRELLFTTSAPDLRLVAELKEDAATLETKLCKRLGNMPVKQYITDPLLARQHSHCHDAYVYASLIHLYRRVEGLEADSIEVETALERGVDHIRRSAGPGGDDDIDSSLLFTLFTFGCEIRAEADRNYLRRCLEQLHSFGLGNVDRAIEVLETVWFQRITNWQQILALFEWEVNLA
ncbi:hypothetical protein PYCC9005_000243 [Savitreella phatthalungensis]